MARNGEWSAGRRQVYLVLRAVTMPAPRIGPAIGFKTIYRTGMTLDMSRELPRIMLEPEESRPQPRRCVIVLDQALPIGRAANAAAVIALTLGNRHPHLAGPDLVDASGHAHPGLIPIGIAVLAASGQELNAARLRRRKTVSMLWIFQAKGSK